MAVSEFEHKSWERDLNNFIKKQRPPVNVRNELDIRYRIDDQCVTIFEVRPSLRDHNEKMENPVARTKYVKSRKIWSVYWLRQDLKWHKYEPVPEVKSLNEFLAVVELDEYSCFWR